MTETLREVITIELMATAVIIIPTMVAGFVFGVAMLCREWFEAFEVEAEKEEKKE